MQLPSSLQSLTFGGKFDQSLEGIQLPSSLQHLTFGRCFDQSLEGIQLPSSLQHLTFGFNFNQSLEGVQLPSSLQSLTFSAKFNQSLEGIQLPSSLQHLTFGHGFNQSLEGIQLPSSLQSLTFGYNFNQSLEGIQLPSSLQSLTFSAKFNQSLEGIQLPSSLQSLTFGDNFNQSLEGIQLPSSLRSFRLPTICVATWWSVIPVGEEVAAWPLSPSAATERRQRGDAEDALRLMTKQRAELTKSRKALEQVLERRSSSHKRERMPTSVQVLMADERGAMLSRRLLAPAAQNSRAQASDDASWAAWHQHAAIDNLGLTVDPFSLFVTVDPFSLFVVVGIWLISRDDGHAREGMVWPLRAERAREPHLAAILPQKRQARKTSSSKGKEPEPEALNLTKATPQSCGVLSTIQSGGVASRVIQLREPFGVRRDGDDVSVHFFTSAASRKFRELSQNPKTALLCWDPQTLTYVTFQGSARELSAAEGKGFWREWVQILYKDTNLFSAWRLDVERLQVVSIGHIESFRKDWHPVELERTSSGWKVVCDGRE
eukprot:s6723_g2.t1